MSVNIERSRGYSCANSNLIMQKKMNSSNKIWPLFAEFKMVESD